MKAAIETEPWFPVLDPATYDWEKHEQFVAQFAKDRRLSPEEIGDLAQRMVDCQDPKTEQELWEALTRGWYGGMSDA